MHEYILNPRSGETVRRSAVVPADYPGARPINYGRDHEVIFTLTPYAKMGEVAMGALAGRSTASPERIAEFIAEFDATATVSPAHAEFVAAIHKLADGSYDTRGADALAVHDTFDRIFPREYPIPPKQAHCRHGIAYSDDCKECEE